MEMVGTAQLGLVLTGRIEEGAFCERNDQTALLFQISKLSPY